MTLAVDHLVVGGKREHLSSRALPTHAAFYFDVEDEAKLELVLRRLGLRPVDIWVVQLTESS